MFSSNSYNRFGGRGSSRGYTATRRGSRQGRRSAAHKTLRSLLLLIGLVLTTIYYSELEAEQALSSDARIIGVEDVASYNWLKAKEPTIITPSTYSHLKLLHYQKSLNLRVGKPPKWTPTARSTKLLEDDPKGTYYRDLNAVYFLSYPIEPVVRSIFKVSPNFNT